MLLPILLPISILIVPLADLVLAVVRRTRRGQAFYQPDKEHLHHRLLEIGHSQRTGGADHVALGRADRLRGSPDQPLLGAADLGAAGRRDRWQRSC